MKDFITELEDMISDILFQNKTDAIESMKSEVIDLENNEEFRHSIRETLSSKEFHENFPYSYKKFPFSIIAYLDHIEVPLEKNFLVQDIIATISIENRVFIEFLIDEFWIQYFPQDFQDKVLLNENYRRLYNLTYGYE